MTSSALASSVVSLIVAFVDSRCRSYSSVVGSMRIRAWAGRGVISRRVGSSIERMSTTERVVEAPRSYMRELKTEGSDSRGMKDFKYGCGVGGMVFGGVDGLRGEGV